VLAGYKQTEVGVIPEDWGVSLLKDCCSKITDGTHDTPKPVRSGVAFLTAIHVKDNWIDFESCLYLTEADHMVIYSRCNPQKNDVLMVNIGAGVATTALVDVDYEFSLKNVALLKPDTRTVGIYLNYSLAHRKPKITQALSSGGAQPFLSLTQIGDIGVPLPPTKAEQEAIAGALSDADALIDSLEQLLTKKRQLKQGAMQELLTGKKRLPGFSGEWKVKRLGDVADTDPENLGSDMNPDLAFNYIALEDVDRGLLRSHSEQLFATAPSRARRKLRLNDVLVSTVRPNLQSHLLFRHQGGSWVCSTGFCVVRCRKGVTHPGYVFCHLFANCVNRQIEALLTGSSYPAINSRDVRALEIPFPDYNEQTAIAAILSDMDEEIAALEARLAKARQLKQGMMQELLAGRIRLVRPSKSGDNPQC